MDNIIEEHIEKALAHYSQDKYYNIMLKAKDFYLKMTGSVDDSEQDYENKMNCFNDWYLLQYRLPRKKCTVMEDYLKSHARSLSEETVLAFKNFNHSIFQYLDKNLWGHYTIKDIYNKKKTILSKNIPLPLLKNDLFIGRMIPLQNEGYLMKGRSLLPADSWPIIKKNMRSVIKSQKEDEITNFLFKLEALNTKYKRYGHVDVSKIFIFE